MSSPTPSSARASPTNSEQENLGSAQESSLDADILRYMAMQSSTGTETASDSDCGEGSWSGCFTQVPNQGASDGTNTQDSDDTHSTISPSQQKGALVGAVRTASRLKLHPYQVSRVKAFVGNPWTSQLADTFCEVLALGNKLDQIISQQPRFTVDTALAKTIKSYTLGVVLSEKLRAYKGCTPINQIFSIISKQQINVPSNLSKNPFAQEVIRTQIGNEITQLRATMKKVIGTSIEKKWSIYKLTTRLIDGTPCNICIPLCARLAVMRKVYVELYILPRPPTRNPLEEIPNFWDSVDTRLEFFRNRVNNNADGIRTILAGTLKDDREKYGAAEDVYDIPEEGGEFEQGISDNL